MKKKNTKSRFTWLKNRKRNYALYEVVGIYVMLTLGL